MVQPGGRRKRGRRALVLRWCCALPVLVVPALFPSAGAAFMASTSDDVNSVASGSLAPPSGLAASQTCTFGTISLVGATSATGTNNDKLVLPVPAGVQPDDILLAQVTNRYDNSIALNTNTPGGWQTIPTRQTNGSGANSLTSVMLWRRVVAGEPTSVTFTLGAGGGSTYLAGGVAAFRGVSTTTAIDSSATTVGKSVNATLPAVTTTTANTMLVFATSKLEDTLQQQGTGGSLWRLASLANTQTESASAGYELFAGQGATGTRTAPPVSGTAATEWIAHTVALRPALVPSASLTWTASPSSTATGYTLERVVGGSVQATATVPSRTATSATDGPLVNGTAYTFRLRTTQGSWTSTAATATLTPSC
jgi:hypothetical protein